MKLSINSAIVKIGQAHSDIDRKARSMREEFVSTGAKMVSERGSFVDGYKESACYAKAELCKLVPAMGTGIAKFVPAKAVLGTYCEKAKLDFLSRGWTGTVGNMFSTTAMLGLKIGVLTFGLAIIAPLYGLVGGLIIWQGEKDAPEIPVPTQGGFRSAGPKNVRDDGDRRSPTYTETRAAIARRHSSRLASSFSTRVA